MLPPGLRVPARVLGAAVLCVLATGCGASEQTHGRGEIVWARSRGRECHRGAPYHGECQGPRRVPVARGAAARRAKALQLGTPAAVRRLLREPAPPPEWVSAVRGDPPDTLLWPVAGGRFVRGFGYVRRRLRIPHDGIDISAPVGTPILAAADGLVAYSDNRIQGYGNVLVLLHADGSATLYAHCRAIFVAAGERVRRGEVVAEVGDTGISRSPHLHFEWHAGGRPVDPEPRLANRPEPRR